MGYFSSFIPEKIKNETVVNLLDRMRRTGRRLHIGWRHAAKQANVRNMKITGSGSLIEDQNNCGYISYGRSDMAYAGCEIIAAYNALLDMGKAADLGQLIDHFEHDGMVLGAWFGTAPMAIADFFSANGFEVETTMDPARFDAIADASDVAVLMYYNDRRSIFKKIHTICITRDSSGYTAHNVYCNGTVQGPYMTVSGLLNGINSGFAKGIVMFGIRAGSN